MVTPPSDFESGIIGRIQKLDAAGLSQVPASQAWSNLAQISSAIIRGSGATS
jgi:hypothetical protein